MSNSFVEAGAAQLHLMASALESAEAKGYFVITIAENWDARSDKHLYDGFGVTLDQWATHWGKVRGRRCITVRVMTDTFVFGFRVPQRKPLMPLIVALDLIGRRAGSKWEAPETQLTFVRYQDYTQYSGRSRETFETVLKIFNMPHIREALTRQYPTRNKD